MNSQAELLELILHITSSLHAEALVGKSYQSGCDAQELCCLKWSPALLLEAKDPANTLCCVFAGTLFSSIRTHCVRIPCYYDSVITFACTACVLAF